MKSNKVSLIVFPCNFNFAWNILYLEGSIFFKWYSLVSFGIHSPRLYMLSINPSIASVIHIVKNIATNGSCIINIFSSSIIDSNNIPFAPCYFKSDILSLSNIVNL